MSYLKQCPICTCILFGRIIIADPQTGDSRHVSKCENGHVVIQDVDTINEVDLHERMEDLKRRIHDNPNLEKWDETEGESDNTEDFDQNV